MALLSLWMSNPSAISSFTIEQVVTSAGDGNLKDESQCSVELREYIAQIKTDRIAAYIEHCLTSGFTKSGIVLQDLVNELGRRLDYKVTNGRYQGTTNAIGFDGLWQSPEGHSIIVEVKTTDAYRISLDTLAKYRKQLLETNKVNEKSSILIIVGRQDTGEVEEQVRGSKHAWDIRLISAEALIKLIHLKENSDETETGAKIRNLLTPLEFTRLDKMVDAMFSTVTDVEVPIDEPEIEEYPADKILVPEALVQPKGAWEFTDSALLQGKREKIFDAVGNLLGTKLIKKSRALCWNSTHDIRVVCTISKKYTKRASYPYWYAYHPQWDEFLKEAKSGFLVLGCMDLPFAFSIPWKAIHGVTPNLNTTTTERSTYWHIHLSEPSPGKYQILLPKISSQLAVDAFRISI